MEEAGPRTYAVRELASELSRLLGAAFPAEIWVQGQLRNLNRSPTGHVYFDLTEPSPLGDKPGAQLAVTLFDGDRRNVNHQLRRSAAGMRMADGVEARIRGRIQWYAPAGRLTLRMTAIDPAYTLGRLTEDRERLLATLRDEGLLARNRLLPLSPVPLSIGLVTSVGSAAHADFLTELATSDLGWRVTVVDARTQGELAPGSIAAALRTVAARHVDVVALVRGGGSRTDLACFDSEVVARTIAALDVPVTTGIGHEIDSSIADLVAHSSAKTPTACAAGLIERVRRFAIDVEGAWTAIAARAERRLDESEQRAAASARHARRATRGALAVRASTCDHASARLSRAAAVVPVRAEARVAASVTELVSVVRRPLDLAEHRLATAAADVRGADPARTLARGWSLARRADGSLVRSTSDVGVGEAITTTVADGAFSSRVTDAAAPGAAGGPDDRPVRQTAPDDGS